MENEIAQNKELTKKTNKPVIRKFEKPKVYSSFICNIRCANITDMQLIKFNKGFRIYYVLFCDIYSKYTWVVPLKDKKSFCNY